MTFYDDSDYDDEDLALGLVLDRSYGKFDCIVTARRLDRSADACFTRI